MFYNTSVLFYLKKDKASFKRILRFLNATEKPSEVTLAKNISSVITHIIIEMEGSQTKDEAKEKAEGYQLFAWLDLQNKLLNGDINVSYALAKIQELLEEH